MESRKNGSVVSCCDKVFVGSIPGYYREKDVRAIFEPYGIVTSVRINFKAENPSLNRGYCILTFRDPALAARLIDTKQIHIGNGRYVICKPYLQGHQLQEEILRHDQRRVIVKQLPSDLAEEEIKNFFDYWVGPVEIVFIYESDDRCPTTTTNRRVRTASVTFFNPNDAQSLFPDPLIEERLISINGKPIKIQRFKYQHMNPDSQTSSVESPATPSSPPVQNLYQCQPLTSPRRQGEQRASLVQSDPADRLAPASSTTETAQLKTKYDHSAANVRFNRVPRPLVAKSPRETKISSFESFLLRP